MKRIATIVCMVAVLMGSTAYAQNEKEKKEG